MRLACAVALALASLVVLPLAVTAAGIWDSKPYTEWSDKEADKVMHDSPWAGKASLTHARAGANLGPVPDWSLIVSVRSALPYRAALLRKEIGQGGTPTAEQTTALAADEPLYVIAISGIPRNFGAQAQAIVQAASLKRSKKDPLRPTDARLLYFDKEGNPAEAPPAQARGGAAPPAPGAAAPPAGGGQGRGGFGRGGGGFGGFGGGGGQDNSGITATILLGFPKSDPITVDEGDLELSTVIGTYNVSKKFKPKEMTVSGALSF